MEYEHLLSPAGSANHGDFKGISHVQRRCNDIPCLVLFVLCVAASVVLSSIGFSQGDPSLLLPSTDFAVEETAENAASAQSDYWFHNAMVSLKNNADVAGGMSALAALLALLWVQLLKKFVRPFLYLTAAAGILCVLALATVCAAFSQQKDSYSWLLWVGIFLYVVALVLVIALVVMRKHINLTSVLFEEACRGVQHSPTVFLSAMLCVTAFIAYVLFWSYSFVYLYSVPADSISTAQLDVEAKKMPQFSTSLRNAMFFQVFVLLWVSAFLSAVYQMSVAGAISAWYFSRDAQGMDADSKKHGGPALISLARAVSISAGSLAFGSMVLAAVQFLNFCVKVAQKKAKASGNCLAKTCLGCISCCLGCIGNFVKFINRYAYIHIAMHGSSFLGASRDVFELLSRRGLSAVAVHWLGDLVLLVGKLMGVGFVTTISVICMQSLGREVSFVTVVLIAFVTFFLFNFFARIVSVGVDTVFVCYAEDCDRNGSADGHGANLYCDPSVHSALQEKIEEHKYDDPEN